MQIHNWDKPGKIDLELARTQGYKDKFPSFDGTIPMGSPRKEEEKPLMIKTGIDRMFWKIACIVAWGLTSFVAIYAVIEKCCG